MISVNKYLFFYYLNCHIKLNQKKIVNSEIIVNIKKKEKFHNIDLNIIDTLFFIEKSNKNKLRAYKLYQFFNINYLKNIYDINLKEKNINSLYTLPNNLIKLIIFDLKNIHFKKFNIKYFNEIACLFLINLWLKNIKNIAKYIKKQLDNVHFKKHRSYFLFFFKILTKYAKPNFKYLQLKGLVLEFRGKLGKGGNSRKKVMSYKYGQYSLSNKMLAINSYKWDIWTKTGSVGCYMKIFYNKYDNLFKFIYTILFINVN